VALAGGQPPQNKEGNPASLRYLVQTRKGAGLASQFVSVLEPYDRDPFIRGVRRLQVAHSADPDSVAALAVDLADGTTDVIIGCEERTRVRVEGGIEFDGEFGLVRMERGKVTRMRMVGAILLACDEARLTAGCADYGGRVAKVQAGPSGNRVVLSPPLPREAGLVGRTIHFLNDLSPDTSYPIRAVLEDGVSTGDLTLVRGFKDANDFGAGYTYLVNPGDPYRVPAVAGLDL
jgi:oligo-alginate lyase